MEQSFMKERKIVPLVITMALPMTVSMLINSLYNIVDSYFVAKISEEAMTALSLVYPVQNLVTAVTVGYGIGVNAVIAFYLGAGKQKHADTAASAGMFFNLLHGVILTGCVFIMPAFLRMFTDDAVTLDYGIRYSNIVFLFSVPIAIGIGFEKIFQSVGKMTVSMIAMLAGCITNIILDPILIFGWWIFPEMGIEGAALATGIGQVVTLVIYLAIYLSKGLAVKIRFKGFTDFAKISRRTYAIGIPAALNLALPSLMISVLNSILAVFSQTYVLVLGAYYKLQTFLYLTANGIVQGMRPVLSYNYGAEEYRRVHGIFRVSLSFIVAVMVFGTILCAAVPDRLIGLFSTGSETIEIGVHALRLICIGFIPSALSVTVSGALEGLGKGGASLWVSLFRYVIIILPAAFILSKTAGASGVWNAFWITEIITAVFSGIMFGVTSKRSLSKADSKSN
ncbi:MAG TPA: MATE family efflux transporter [Candidatus Eubacterium faecavium]|nr:MATE family efflux transporter [Candidatus Eubacterium faecavium]